jgi:hypothetical protein
VTRQKPRSRASEARKIAAGGRRLPSIVLGPEEAKALGHLLALGYYADSIAGCVRLALVEASCSRKPNTVFPISRLAAH